MKSRLHIFLVTGAVLIVLLMSTTMLFMPLQKPIISPSNTNVIQMEPSDKTKVVLLYTDFFKGRWYLRWNHQYYPCKYRCRFTYRKSEMSTAGAVGFHDADLPRTFPQRTKSNQIWFYANFESPVNSYVQDYRNVFNWTMSYRQDSDIYAPYGDFSPLDCYENQLAEKLYSNRDFSQGKTKMAAWVSSNCRDSFGRFSLVKKLSKYIQVDIFGKCGLNYCPRGTYNIFSNDCSLKLRKYKFYLAFENSRCVDYITEKYWHNALNNELVPVVMGGADYENIAIPGSYINVNDFESVKQLADYLMHLDANPDIYNKYFQWKMQFKLDTPYLYGCSICTALHSNKANQTKVYPSLHRYWKEGKCMGKLTIV